jgi:TonB family protein
MMKISRSLMIAAAFWVAQPAAASGVAVSDWQDQVLAIVAAQRTTPRSAILRRSSGVVEMQVEVDGRGMIERYEMAKSSGVPILDNEADLILLRVGSFPAPPDGRPKRMIVPIRW